MLQAAMQDIVPVVLLTPLCLLLPPFRGQPTGPSPARRVISRVTHRR